MISVKIYPERTHALSCAAQEPAPQALLAFNPQLYRLRFNGVRSVVRNGQGISQYLSQGLANPHPQSIVNGTIGDLEGARPTVIRPPVIVYDNPPKNPSNPFSWSANGIDKPTDKVIDKPPVKIGRALLAGHTIEGRRAAVRPKPAIGAAPDPAGLTW